MVMDHIRFGIKNLTRKKFRNFLTILSIVIGVASVVVISAIGDIGKDTVNQELNSLGIGGISITTDKKVTDASLSANQLETVRSISGVEQAIPIMVEYLPTYMHDLVAESIVWGIDAGAKQVISLEPIYGRLINKTDINTAANVCIVDENTAKVFYHRSNVVGKSLTLQTEGRMSEFEIIGVAASGGNILQNMLGQYIPSFVYIPYTTMQGISGRTNFDQIAVKINPAYSMDSTGVRIVSALERTAGINSGYRSQNMMEQKDKLDNILSTVTIVLAAVAGVSLVVAGLGIMTVMLVSVNERTREIGIKKSIGASKGVIVLEFLFEAFTMSALGSIIGCALGLAIVWIGCIIFSISFVPNIKMILFCIAFSISIGIVFGAYPAMTAAKLKPVDALRFE